MIYEGIFDSMKTYIETYGMRLLFVLCIIVIGIMVIWLISFAMKKLLLMTNIDGAIVSFITSVFKIIMAVVIILLCASVLELSTSGLLVSLSSLALAVALALKDSFSNLANGILIIANKPFRRGDKVSIGGVEGNVQSINLLTLELITPDNKKIVIPNSKVLNSDIINYSALAIRRCDLEFGVAYGSDMDLVEEILNDVCLDHPKILKSMKIQVYMKSHDASQITYVVKVWANNEDYGKVKNSMYRLVYDAFEKAHIEIPFNQIDIHLDNNTEIEEPKAGE